MRHLRSLAACGVIVGACAVIYKANADARAVPVVSGDVARIAPGSAAPAAVALANPAAPGAPAPNAPAKNGAAHPAAPAHSPAAPATTQAIPDVRMRSPQQTIADLDLPPGYHLELVASEPDLICPVLCTWDGDGGMYVAEMRSYMRDIDDKGSFDPISRVSRWEDTHGNGVYDKHTVFADHLVLPRMVLPLDDRILIRQTNTKDIYSFRDTTGDGVADQKTLFYKGGKQEGNLEHQPSALNWNMDNWMYMTNERTRLRFTRGKVEKGEIPMSDGQWGMAMDDTGRTIFMIAGAENPAMDFQFPLQYGKISLKGETPAEFDKVYPALKLTDVEGGVGRLWPGGGLNHFTGCAGGSIYRGDALPHDLYGDYILPEPVGRLIRRAHLTNVNGEMVLSNVYNHKEFIVSHDANFRPVWTATGPDGDLYICDMYHGIIQEANWVKVGSYLRPQVLKYGFQTHINAGRIYRLVHDGAPARRARPHMLQETPAQLVNHLSDPNGWWRDTAQKLIILRADKSVVPALEGMARDAANPITRLHALWTLDGLDSATPQFVLEKLKDSDPRVRAAAIRIAEPLIRKNDPIIIAALRSAARDENPDVAIQCCLSLMYASAKDADPIVASALADKLRPAPANAVVKEAVNIYQKAIAQRRADEARAKALATSNAHLAAIMVRGKTNFQQTCSACHGLDGKGTPVPENDGTTIAPPLAGSHRLQGDKRTLLRIVLCGLNGPNNGKIYKGAMVGFVWADDVWLSSILTYARNEWGNKGDEITPADLMHMRKLLNGRDRPFTLAELGTLQDEGYEPIASRPDGSVALAPDDGVIHGSTLTVETRGTKRDIGHWDTPDQWVCWRPDFSKPGLYKIVARFAAPIHPNQLEVELAGKHLLVTAPKTGSWDDYATVTIGPVQIDKAGPQTLILRPHGVKNWIQMNCAGIDLKPAGH